MSLKAHFELLASYNQWINAKIYAAAGELGADELAQDRGAFFGSILGTLNHILVADIIWLKRFAAHPGCLVPLREIVELPDPRSLDQILFDDFAALSEQRSWLDHRITGSAIGSASCRTMIWIASSPIATPKGFPPTDGFRAWFCTSSIIKLTIVVRSPRCCPRRVRPSRLPTCWC